MFTWEITTHPFFALSIFAIGYAIFSLVAAALRKDLRWIWVAIPLIAIAFTGLIEKHETGEFYVIEVSATTTNEGTNAPTFKDTTLLCFKEDDLTSCFPYNTETGEYDEEFAVEIVERVYPTTFEVLPKLTISETNQ